MTTAGQAMRNLGVIILALLLCVSAWAADGRDVAGVVVDTEGVPVAGAPVRLVFCEYTSVPDGRVVGETTTDAQGTFKFAKAFAWPEESAPASTHPRYLLLCAPPGRGMAYLALLRGDSSDELRLQLTAREVRTVTVVDEDGRPVQDARVWIHYSMPRSVAVSEMQRLLTIPLDLGLGDRTDADGEVEVVVPAGATTTFAASKPGYATGAGQDRITLDRGGTVTGRVLGPDLKGIAEARVMCSPIRRGAMMPAITDAQGRFELRDVPTAVQDEKQEPGRGKRGEVILKASLWQDGIIWTGEEKFDLEPGQSAERDIIVRRKLRLSGTVVDPDSGAALSGVGLRLFNHGITGVSENQVVATNEAGRFTFALNAGASVQIMVDRLFGGGALLARDWEATAPDGGVYRLANLTADKLDVSLPLKLRKLAPLSGTVVDEDGRPVAAAMVLVHQNLPVTLTDAAGRFSFRAAPTDLAGEIVVWNKTVGAVAPFAAGAAEMNIVAPPLVARDCIARTPDGEPADGLPLGLALQDAQGGILRLTSAEPTETNAKGKCRLEGLIAGATYVALWKAKGDYSTGNVQFKTPEETGTIQLIAPKYNKSFAVTVKNEDGQPVAGARIQLAGPGPFSNERRAEALQAKSDAEGILKLDHLSGGRIDFSIVGEGYRAHRASTDVSDAKYEAVITRQNDQPRHTIIVRTPDGKPLEGEPIRTFAEGAETQVVTDANGLAKLPVYPRPTDVTVLCNHPELGWDIAYLSWNEDGATLLTPRKPVTPRKIKLLNGDGKALPGMVARLTFLYELPASGRAMRQLNLQGLPVPVQMELGLQQVTDADGAATFPLVDASSRATVNISGGEYATHVKQLQENNLPEELRIDKPAFINGFVTFPEPAAAGTSYIVKAVDDGAFRRSYSAQAGRNGLFEMQVEPGEYQVSVETPAGGRYMLREIRTVKVAPAEVKDVTLELREGIAVRGHYIPKDGKLSDPPPKMLVSLGALRGSASVTVNKDGTFGFFVPGPGEYRLSVPVPGQLNAYVTYQDTVKVPGEAAVENFEVKEK